MKVKKYNWSEARQRGDSPKYQPPKISKLLSSTSCDLKKNSFYSFETEEKTAPQESEQQDLTNDELGVEFKSILAT